MTETNETHVITDLPKKESKLKNPFVKKATETLETTETAAKRLSPVKKAGIALLAAGAFVGIGAVLAKKAGDDTEPSEAPSDTDTNN